LRNGDKRNTISRALQHFRRQKNRLLKILCEQFSVEDAWNKNMVEPTSNHAARRIDEAFPYKVCINLDRRPDRWREMQHKFKQHGIHSVKRFAALDGDDFDIPSSWTHSPGAYGCLQSHLDVVREARRLGAESVLIFEDDAAFDPELQEKFSARISQLPPGWDMLYFGALHKDEPTKVSDNIARISRANSTYAYAVRATVFDAFIELNAAAEDVLDNNSFILQEKFNCYCFMPHLAWVETDYSDVQARLEHHWYLRESLVLFGHQADSLLSDTTIIFAHRGQDETGFAAAENLLFLVNYYNEFFESHIAMLIVEQGARPTIKTEKLPINCEYVFLQEDGSFNRERCFIEGIRSSKTNGGFLVLSDSDIYLETLDFRANLRMCEQYDCATGFSKIITLGREDSTRLRRTSITRGIDVTKTSSHVNDEREAYCCFFNRSAIRNLEGWKEDGLEKTGFLQLLQARQQLRVFQSPNHALRLHQD
jgi:glycosyl transferase family 25